MTTVLEYSEIEFEGRGSRADYKRHGEFMCEYIKKKELEFLGALESEWDKNDQFEVLLEERSSELAESKSHVVQLLAVVDKMKGKLRETEHHLDVSNKQLVEKHSITKGLHRELSGMKAQSLQQSKDMRTIEESLRVAENTCSKCRLDYSRSVSELENLQERFIYYLNDAARERKVVNGLMKHTDKPGGSRITGSR
ncbi:hypothetical protein T484DRAFT_1756119 [Baffinella frigidus]|nr:hypothetical protein T484DRAFT_1756119 [Cryptophyta sp. CCMP2293]